MLIILSVLLLLAVANSAALALVLRRLYRVEPPVTTTLSTDNRVTYLSDAHEDRIRKQLESE